jgi:hypothetical protein
MLVNMTFNILFVLPNTGNNLALKNDLRFRGQYRGTEFKPGYSVNSTNLLPISISKSNQRFRKHD